MVSDPVTETYEPIYMTQLGEIDLQESNTFTVSAKHIKEYDMNLYYQFIYFPPEMIISFDEVIKNMFYKHFMG